MRTTIKTESRNLVMAENPDGDVDQYFDDAGDVGYLPADHVTSIMLTVFEQPLMSRLQNALTKQLTDEHERVDLGLREKVSHSK